MCPIRILSKSSEEYDKQPFYPIRDYLKMWILGFETVLFLWVLWGFYVLQGSAGNPPIPFILLTILTAYLVVRFGMAWRREQRIMAEGTGR